MGQEGDAGGDLTLVAPSHSEREPVLPDASRPFPFENIAVQEDSCCQSAWRSFVEVTVGGEVAL